MVTHSLTVVNSIRGQFVPHSGEGSGLLWMHESKIKFTVQKLLVMVDILSRQGHTIFSW